MEATRKFYIAAAQAPPRPVPKFSLANAVHSGGHPAAACEPTFMIELRDYQREMMGRAESALGRPADAGLFDNDGHSG